MNSQPTFKFPRLDTALNAVMVAAMALSCALLVGVQGVQAIVA